MMLTAMQNTQLDYVALAMVAALAVFVAALAIRKHRLLKKKEAAPAASHPSAEQKTAPVAPGAAGEVKLYNVPPKTAAMLMAIVADKTGKPLNELRFISIQEVE